MSTITNDILKRISEIKKDRLQIRDNNSFQSKIAKLRESKEALNPNNFNKVRFYDNDSKLLEDKKEDKVKRTVRKRLEELTEHLTVKTTINKTLNKSNKANTSIDIENKSHDLKLKMETIKRNKQEIQSFSRELTWFNDKWNKNDISEYNTLENKINDNPFLNCHLSTMSSQSNNNIVRNDIQMLISKLQQNNLNFDDETLINLSKLNIIINNILKDKQ